MTLPTDIANRFWFHPANEMTRPKHEALRKQALEFAEFIVNTVPLGRHQSLALTSLQETMFWANAGIACDTVEAPVNTREWLPGEKPGAPAAG